MGVVELLSEVLAKQNGWSLHFAEGFTAGQALRRRGEPIPRHAMVGIDEFALGFRAGFFTRQSSASLQVQVAAILETEEQYRPGQAV